MADINCSIPTAVPPSHPASKKRAALDVPAKAAPKYVRVSSTNTAVQWTEEMHNRVMTLVGEKKGPFKTVSAAAWKAIALAMSAMEWTSSEGGTYTMSSFTAAACQSRYNRYKGAFIAPKNVKWTAETHAYFMGLVDERKAENGTVSKSRWKQIAEIMSAKEWTSSSGSKYTLSFTWMACQRRYSNYKDAAFEESAGIKVVWTKEMHNLVVKLAGEQMSENGIVAAAWKKIAEVMSSREWATSDGGTYRLPFTWTACQMRYTDYKGAYIEAAIT
jgi:hypothetical protein